ncbi:transcription termination factor 2-like [Cotesia glomerata]|nr:transcription termination factor 2-like [Cotesia glomerata]
MAYRSSRQVLASSDDDSDNDWDKSPKNKKRRFSQVTEITTANEDDDIDDASEEEDEELNNSNRMTPSIEKAIQRSISKLSQENLNLDAEDRKDEKTSLIDHNYCVSKSPVLFEDDDPYHGYPQEETIDREYDPGNLNDECLNNPNGSIKDEGPIDIDVLEDPSDLNHLNGEAIDDSLEESFEVPRLATNHIDKNEVTDGTDCSPKIKNVETTHYKVSEEAASEQAVANDLKILKVMFVRTDEKGTPVDDNGIEDKLEENNNIKWSEGKDNGQAVRKFKLIERRSSDASHKSSETSVISGSPKEAVTHYKILNSQEKIITVQSSCKDCDQEINKDDQIFTGSSQSQNNDSLLSTLVKVEMKSDDSQDENEDESVLADDSFEYRVEEEKEALEVKPKINIKPTSDHSTRDLGKKALQTFKEQQSLTVERLQDLHGSLISRPTETSQEEDPAGLNTNLMPHQQHALAWLLWREQQKPPGGVLADEMGLGKTLTMISLVLKTLPEFQKKKFEDSSHRFRLLKYFGGTLVVCPASLVAQWAQEIRKHCKKKQLTYEIYHGPNRESNIKRLVRNDIIITTYKLLSRETTNRGISNLLFKVHWERVILDEAHIVRNHKSQMCDAVCRLTANKRWAITGTPIHNKQMDLYAILKFLRCSPFDDLRIWKRWVDNKDDAGHQRLTTVMKTLMLRRTKQELMNKGQMEPLTTKVCNTIRVTLDSDERLVYEKVLMYSRTLFAQFLHQRSEKQSMFEMGASYDHRRPTTSPYIAGFNKAQQQLLAQHADIQSHEILVLLLRLRQICCHPSLIHSMLDQQDLDQQNLEDGAINFQLLNQINNVKLKDNTEKCDIDDDDDEESGVSERVIENLLTKDNPVFDTERQSAKLRSVISTIKSILAKKEKVIVVSQWVGYLQIVAESLKSIEGATYKLYVGSITNKNREKIIDLFNDENQDPQILLLSLNAGGVGLNLMGGNHLMLIDIHWNPQLELQAQDRIHRFGQKRNVFIYKFICSDTIEERIEKLQEKKLKISGEILSGSGKVSTKLTLDDLRSLFNI